MSTQTASFAGLGANTISLFDNNKLSNGRRNVGDKSHVVANPVFGRACCIVKAIAQSRRAETLLGTKVILKADVDCPESKICVPLGKEVRTKGITKLIRPNGPTKLLPRTLGLRAMGY